MRLKHLLLFFSLFALGCGGQLKVLKDKHLELDELIVKARELGAMECAPVELARAQAQYDFAQVEFREGDLRRAKEHLREGRVLVQSALKLSQDCLIEEPTPVPVVVIDPDRDQDGILNEDDGCPDTPEDKDDFEDADGCPDPDNDQDGIVDPSDACPNEAEDRDGFEDDDGCPEPDNDNDGIVDTVDGCPNVAEDMNGIEDEDGCPETDSDGDGILNPVDACPNQPENFNGIQDDDGCPENDTDGDGIVDPRDSCPNQPETFNGIDDEDGCPEGDTDNDGLLDPVDQCPTQPEDLDGFQDEDGCPDLDNDGDGIVDASDACPMVPENINGWEDEDGCPDEQPVVILTKERIEIREQIHFETGKAIIKPESYYILDGVASIMRDHDEIRIRIEGHTDSVGSMKYNMDLSKDRAKSVYTYLVSRGGVAGGSMTYEGFGPTMPIADNNTDEGRAQNRRVEFHVVRN